MEILKLQKNLMLIAEKEQIAFVNGKGEKKPQLQQLYNLKSRIILYTGE